MNETLQTIKARRSVRAYTEQQVSAEDLSLILEAATYAPNGMHLETWHFTAIHSQYLQPIITQYFIDNKSEIWLLFLIAHSKR